MDEEIWLYGDTNFSRLVDGDVAYKQNQVNQIKEIWNGKNVVLVEGAKYRVGVGNNLLENTQQVKRILGPAESAFDRYSEILHECVRQAQNTDNVIVLIALGPTATVLAYDLAKMGIQAIDIGHLDISYERVLTGNSGAIPGKYTNEAVGGNIVADCYDETYLEQIVAIYE